MENESVVIVDKQTQPFQISTCRNLELPADEHGQVFVLHVVQDRRIIVICIPEPGRPLLPSFLIRIKGQRGPEGILRLLAASEVVPLRTLPHNSLSFTRNENLHRQICSSLIQGSAIPFVEGGGHLLFCDPFDIEPIPAVGNPLALNLSFNSWKVL